MRAVLYVLNCNEFAPLVDAGRNAADVTVEEHGRYLRLSSPERLRLDRGATGLNDAVWFAAPTGGIEGKITRFDDAVLEITADDPAA